MGSSRYKLLWRVSFPLGIFILAFILRVWGINNGLPYAQLGEESPDITDSLNLAQGDNPRYAYHRVAWPMAQIPLHAAHFVYRKLTDWSYNFQDFEADYFLRRQDFILSTRIYLAGFAALACVVVYLTGKVATQREIPGVMAGVLLAVHPFHSYLSHQALPDAFATFWIAVNLLGVVMIARDGRCTGYVLAGVGAAVAMLARLQSVMLVMVPILAAHVIAWYRTPDRPMRFLWRQWGWAAGAFVIASVAFNPLIVLKPARVVDDIQFIFEDRYTGVDSELPSFAQYLPLENFSTNLKLPETALRPYLLLSVLLASVVELARRRLAGGLLVLALVAFVASILPTTAPRVTFFLPAVVPAVLIVALGLDDVAQVRKTLRWLSLSLFVVLVGLSLRETVFIDSVLARPNTQVLAREFIDANVSPHAAIMSGNEFVYSVPLERDMTSIRRLAASDKDLAPKYDFLLDHPARLSPFAYDMFGVENADQIQSDDDMLSFLAEHHIAYVVETSYCDGEPSYQAVSSQSFPKITQAIRKNLTLLFEVSPFKSGGCDQSISTRTALEYMHLNGWFRTGPVLRIYQVNETAAG
jgi:hypothetical protein